MLMRRWPYVSQALLLDFVIGNTPPRLPAALPWCKPRRQPVRLSRRQKLVVPSQTDIYHDFSPLSAFLDDM